MTVTVTLPDGRRVAWGGPEHIEATAHACAGIQPTRDREVAMSSHARLFGEDVAASIKRRTFELIDERLRGGGR